MSHLNILFLMTDQQRFDGLGANGNRFIQTPNLDRLASESANFQNAFVQSPVCVPSRVTWFTGRYPHSHRNRVNYTPLDRRETLMQKRFQQAGYRTGAVGKLHLHPPTAEHARTTGFDRVLIHDSGRADRHSAYLRWRAQNDPQAGSHYNAVAKDIPAGKNPFRSALADRYTETTWVGEQARAMLREFTAGDRPFFFYCSFFKPHSPYTIPEAFASMYDGFEIPLPRKSSIQEIERLPAPVRKQILRGKSEYDTDRGRLQWIYRSYYGAISQIDREVGLILKELESSSKARDTIVVFSTDHGDQLLEHGLFGKNVFFEASVHIPFLVRLPGRIRAARYTELIEAADLAPTLFDFCGIETPPDCQGRSFRNLVETGRGSYEPREFVVAENIIPEVITSGALDLPYERGKGVGGILHPDAKMIRTRRWKLDYYVGHGGDLYDLEHDPAEERNLYDDPAHRPARDLLQTAPLDWLITADEPEQIAPRWLV